MIRFIYSVTVGAGGKTSGTGVLQRFSEEPVLEYGPGRIPVALDLSLFSTCKELCHYKDVADGNALMSLDGFLSAVQSTNWLQILSGASSFLAKISKTKSSAATTMALLMQALSHDSTFRGRI